MLKITRENVDQILDNRQLYVAINNGRWWAARRNGKTKTWKRDANRVYIPFKYGLRGFGAITEEFFGIANGESVPSLSHNLFRHVDDVPENLRP